MGTEHSSYYTFDHTGKECPCCASQSWRIGGKLSPWSEFLHEKPHLIECRDCGTAHLPPLKLCSLDRRAESVTGCDAAKPTHRMKAYANVRRLLPFLGNGNGSSPKKALVIGCDIGYEIDALLNEFPAIEHIDGVEPTKVSADIATQRFAHEKRVSIHSCLVEDFKSGPYDLVVTTMVWEHITNPHAALQHVAEQQCANSVLALQVPRYDNIFPKIIRSRIWHGIEVDHLWYFSSKGIISLARRCGYSPLKLINTPRLATPGFALFKISTAILRHLYPYLNSRRQKAVKQWAERSQVELNKKWGKGTPLQIGFLRDAMTLVGVRNE